MVLSSRAALAGNAALLIAEKWRVYTAARGRKQGRPAIATGGPSGHCRADLATRAGAVATAPVIGVDRR
jgi:hypothetical protein